MQRQFFNFAQALSYFVFVLITLIISSGAEAARVTKVSGKQVIIEIETTEMNEGQKFFVIIDGKKKGVVVITKISKGRALGKITKGKAELQATLESTTKSATTARNSVEPSEESGDPGTQKQRGNGKRKAGEEGDSVTYVGVLAGYAMDSQSVKDTAGNSVSMSGGGYSLKGFGDMPLSGHIGAIGRAGVEQVTLSGGGFSTSILYATIDALIRYSFSDSGFIPYVAGGGGIHYPISKSSSILDVPRISATTVFFGDLGFNYQMSPEMILVGLLEYGYFPPSNDVTTNFITARLGAGWRF